MQENNCLKLPQMGGVGFHRNGFSSKRVFIETGFHQNGFSLKRVFIETGFHRMACLMKTRFDENPLNPQMSI
jgi:hypothetical protein